MFGSTCCVLESTDFSLGNSSEQSPFLLPLMTLRRFRLTLFKGKHHTLFSVKVIVYSRLLQVILWGFY